MAEAISLLRANLLGVLPVRSNFQKVTQDRTLARADEQVSLESLINLEQKLQASSVINFQNFKALLRKPFQIQLSENAKRVIGENGVRRFNEFKNYQRGWDLGHGEPLSVNSVRIFEWFLSQMPDLASCEPSLFLTHQGNLQLGWETNHGDAVEIEFFSNKLEFYIESLNIEDAVALRDSGNLISQLRSIIS